MKTYDQLGARFVRTGVNDDEKVCRCCQAFDHGAAEYLPTTTTCEQCGEECKCACHQPK